MTAVERRLVREGETRMADDRLMEIFQTIRVDDLDKLRTSQYAILDMVRAKIEAGQVASLALLMVAKDPVVSGEATYTGSRFLVHPTHLDIIDDVYHEMMCSLVKQYKITPDQLRKDRNRSKQ